MKRYIKFLILLFIFIIVVFGAAGYFLGFFGGNNQFESISNIEEQSRGDKMSDNLTPGASEDKTDFDKTGNLVNTDPLVSAHGPDFSLVYEEPGKPALKISLKFTAESRCDLGEEVQACSIDKLRVGDRVIVKGILKNNSVEVVELSKQTAAGLANPASVYCESQGGKVEIRKDAQGNETGYCISPTGKECEEWSFYRKECKL